MVLGNFIWTKIHGLNCDFSQNPAIGFQGNGKIPNTSSVESSLRDFGESEKLQGTPKKY